MSGPRVTRYTFTAWDRGQWGHEEIHVEEVCGLFDWPNGKHWRITDGSFYWHREIGRFILPSTNEHWAEIRYATADDALAEAPRAVAQKLKAKEKILVAYDAEQAKEGGRR